MWDLDLVLNEIYFKINSGKKDFLHQKDLFNFKDIPLKYAILREFKRKR